MISVVDNKKRFWILFFGFDLERKKDNVCYVCDGKDDWVLVCYGE